MKKIILISLVLVSMSSQADITGNTLIEGFRAYSKANDETSSMSGGEMYSGAFYQGYVNATATISSGQSWCIPTGEEISIAQVYDVVGQYLTNNPAKRSQEGVSIINNALSTAFPCPQ